MKHAMCKKVVRASAANPAVTATAIAFTLACALLVSGCASPPPPPPKPVSYVVLLENPAGGTGRVIVTGNKGQQTLSAANTGANMDGSQVAKPVDAAQFDKDFSATLAARPMLPAQYFLYFETGGVSLTPESQALLQTIITDVTKRPAADVSIIGHTDTVGKAEINEAIALKRAQAISELLQQKGMQPFALTVASHGKRNLLVATPDETPEPRNRRVEVSVR